MSVDRKKRGRRLPAGGGQRRLKTPANAAEVSIVQLVILPLLFSDGRRRW
jgi:hypothetical protein